MIEFIKTDSFTIEKNSGIAFLDADKLMDDLIVRKWQTGDRFTPFGMKGSKLVSDYMTDRKFSRIKKESQWLLCSGSEIVWVIGERTDERFKIDHRTKKVLKITMSPI